MERFELHENGLNLVFEVTDEREIKFLHFSACPFATEKFTQNPLFIPACEKLRGIPFFSHA